MPDHNTLDGVSSGGISEKNLKRYGVVAGALAIVCGAVLLFIFLPSRRPDLILKPHDSPAVAKPEETLRINGDHIASAQDETERKKAEREAEIERLLDERRRKEILLTRQADRASAAWYEALQAFLKTNPNAAELHDAASKWRLELSRLPNSAEAKRLAEWMKPLKGAPGPDKDARFAAVWEQRQQCLLQVLQQRLTAPETQNEVIAWLEFKLQEAKTRHFDPTVYEGSNSWSGVTPELLPVSTLAALVSSPDRVAMIQDLASKQDSTTSVRLPEGAEQLIQSSIEAEILMNSYSISLDKLLPENVHQLTQVKLDVNKALMALPSIREYTRSVTAAK